MKIIFNKYGGLKTIEDRQLLVQSSSNANYVDIYYQDDNGNFADETVNLATIAFKRADSFEIMEKTCDAVREELTNKLLYFRYVFQEDDLAVNGELQITVRLKQVVFDPEDETQILLIKQRAMGKLVAHIYEAVGTDYEEYNVIDGRLLQLELWQSTFDGTYYDVTQIDAIIAQEVLNRNNAINDHNSNANAHASIRQEITNLENDMQEQIDDIDDTLQNHESRIDELEQFAENLETNITEEIEDALDNKADLVDGKVPLEQLPDVEDVLTGDITSHNHATEIGNHNTSETAHSDIRQAITDIQTIIATIDGEPDADSVINKLHEIVALLNGYAEGTTLADLLSGKVDKIDGKGLTKNELTDVLVEAYNAAYTHSQSIHAPTNAQANVIEGVQVNGVDLSVANKKVNVTVPTIPDISLNDTQATAGKYISKIEVDATDKHKLIVTKADLPTLRPTIELEVASLTTLTEAEKLAIKNTLSSLIVDDKIDGTKFDDIVLVTTNDLIRLHYSSIDYYVDNPQITVIFETQIAKYMLHVPVNEYTHSSLTSTSTYTKTEIDAMIGDIETLLGGI